MIKKSMMTMAMLFIIALLTAQCSRTVESYTFEFGGKTYEIVKEMKTWSEASAIAVTRGGYLVEINSSGEQNAIYDAIINGAQIPSNYTSVSNGGGIAYVWIGASDQNQEGIWLWDGNNDNSGTNFWNGQGQNGQNNGSAVNGAYVNWGGTGAGVAQEPDNYSGEQHYAAIGLSGWPSGSSYLGSAGEWNDIIGSVPLYFVIEYNGSHSQDISNQNHFRISFFPNPTSSFIRFNRPDLVRFVEIFNLKGQKLLSTHKTEIDLSSYKKGLYLIRISDRYSSSIQKLILK